jgi:hypothetical protein
MLLPVAAVYVAARQSAVGLVHDDFIAEVNGDMVGNRRA